MTLGWMGEASTLPGANAAAGIQACPKTSLCHNLLIREAILADEESISKVSGSLGGARPGPFAARSTLQLQQIW